MCLLLDTEHTLTHTPVQTHAWTLLHIQTHILTHTKHTSSFASAMPARLIFSHSLTNTTTHCNKHICRNRSIWSICLRHAIIDWQKSLSAGWPQFLDYSSCHQLGYFMPQNYGEIRLKFLSQRFIFTMNWNQ